MGAGSDMNIRQTRELLARNNYNVIVVDWNRGTKNYFIKMRHEIKGVWKKLLGLQWSGDKKAHSDTLKIFCFQVLTQHSTIMQDNMSAVLEALLHV